MVTQPDLAKRSLGSAGQAGGERTMIYDRQKESSLGKAIGARGEEEEPGGEEKEGGRRGWGG